MVEIDDKTKVSLKFNNLYAILVSIATFAVVVSGWYASINNKLTNIENTLAKIEKNFTTIHEDVVKNHDAIIVLNMAHGM